MTSIQTTVETAFPIGFAGQLYGFGHDVDSYANGETTEAIDHGIAVMQGAVDREVLRASGLDAQLLGISVHTHGQNTTGNNEVEPNYPIGILSKGDIYVQPEVTVAKFEPVYVRVVAGAGEILGALRNDVDGGDAIRLPGAYFYTAGTSSVPAVVRMSQDPAAPRVSQAGEFTFNVANASITADTTGFGYQVPVGRTFIVDAVYYHNATGLAEDAANFFEIIVQDSAGAKVAANWSTETGEEGTIAADTPVLLVNGTLANRTFVSGTRINVLFDETGTATLPAGTVQITGRLV